MGDFQLLDTPLDLDALRKNLLDGRAGAYCAYEGWVRDKNLGKPVAALNYHGYPELAPSVAMAILAEARENYDIEAAAAAHRTGELVIGDIAIWVGVTAVHRYAAFLACRYIVDEIKHRLPIWKQEVYTDGSTAWIQSNPDSDSSSPPESAKPLD